MTTVTGTSISQLLEAVQAATARVEEKDAAEGQARSAAVAARNELNEAQKKLDRALAEFRKGAPRDSDWHRDTRGHQGLPVA